MWFLESRVRRLASIAALGLLLALVGSISLAMAAGPKLPRAAAPPPPTPQQDLDRLIAAFPDGLTPQQIGAVAASASEPTARAALQDVLTQRLVQQPTAAPVETSLEFYARRLDDIEHSFGAPEPAGGGSIVAAEPPRWSLARLLLEVLVIVGLAGVAAFFVRRSIDRRAAVVRHSSTRERLERVTADVAGFLTFCAVVVAIYLIMRPTSPAAPATLMAVLRFAAIVGGALAFCRLVFAPERPELRLVGLSDSAAAQVQRAIVSFIALAVLPSTISRILTARGWHPDATLGVALTLTTPPLVYALWLLMKHQRPLRQQLAASLGLNGEQSAYLGLLTPALTLYLVGIWLLSVDASLHGEPDVLSRAVGSLVLLLLVPLGARWARVGLERFYATGNPQVGLEPASGVHVAHAAAEEHFALVRPAKAVPSEVHVTRLMRAVWVVLLVAAVLAAAFLWGFNPNELGVGDLLVRLLLNVGVILLLGYVGWALFQRWVDRRIELARLEADETRAQRLQTLLPLFRAFVRVSLVAVLTMIVLASLGIEIGPLLAGAGVVGIAIGLGAQQTIADILAGVFFLFEDSFRMGDYVEVGNIRGTVEGISLRSLKLRHQRGMLHTLPFGQIKALTNYTRDWSLMRLEFRLVPDTDIDLVKRIVKTIGKELSADPEFGNDFIDPIKSQGVRNVEPNAIVIGVKYITKPGKQFTIRREAYKRIIAAFREHGIELSSSNVVVRVENAVGAPDAVVGAAAQMALSAAKPAA